MAYRYLLPDVPSPPLYKPLDPDFIDTPIHTYFERTVQRHPNRLALSDGKTSYSFDEANSLANRIAHRIIALGIQGNVGIYMDDTAEYPICLLAALKAGCGVLILEPKLPAKRIQYMAENANLKAILTKTIFREQAGESFSKELGLITIDEIPASAISRNPDLAISPNDPAVMIYTSGSTGQPKGILHTHKSWMNSMGAVAQLEKYNPADRLTQLYSPSSSAAAITLIFAFISGASFHNFNVDKRSLNEFPKWAMENEITVFRTTGSTFRQIFSPSPNPKLIKSLRLAIVGGEMVYQSDFEQFKKWFSTDAHLRAGGGMSEALLMASCYLNHTSEFDGERLPMGYILDSQKVDILDEAGQPLPQGESGIVAISGPSVVSGYYNEESPSFQSSPYNLVETQFISGDVGHIDANGLLCIDGRKDQMVKVRGFRVELGEVEAQLLKLKGVLEACVMADQGRNKNARVIAYIVPDRNHIHNMAQVRDGLAEILPNYMIPSRVILLDQMPRGTSGKIDRLALPKPDSKRPGLKQPYIAATTNLEMELTAIWEEVLGYDKVGIKDDFQDLGGDSQAATQIFLMIESALCTRLSPSLLLNSPTIQDLAKTIISQREGAETSLVNLRKAKDGMPTLILFAPLFGDVIIFRDILNRLPEGYGLAGVQSWTEDRQSLEHKSVEEMATHFLQEIKAQFPEGPYILGGFSLGGVIAYQAAAKLIGEGHTVNKVILFDSYGPGKLKGFDSGRYLDLLKETATIREKSAFLWRGVEKGTTRLKHSLISILSKGQGNVHLEIPIQQIDSPYFAPELNVEMIMFTSSDEKVWSHDGGMLLGWDRVVKGEIEHHALPGDHHNHFRGENAKTIVDVIINAIQ